MICQACQAELPPNAKFCISCGTKVALVCPSCQAEVTSEQKFCAECGARLAAETKVPAAPVSPPESPVRGTTSLNKPQSEEGDRRVVTVLFTDVSGFTAMSEKLDPEEVTEIVNQFFNVLTQPIYKYGGVVDKYIGDAIMALFGAPVAHEDDPFRAVSAAWEMQLAAKEFAAKLLAKTGIQLRIRVGLNTGLVVAGAVGGAQKQDYTVMGDTVNLAQRMESNAPLGGVLVTYETFKLTRHAFEFQEKEPIKVKGKEELVRVYDLVAPLSKHAIGKKNPFVGRTSDLSRLKLCLDSARTGPQLVVVSGEAGIGKSRLSQEFLSTLSAPMFKGRCPSWAQETSYALISSFLMNWLELPSGTPHEQIVRRLQEVCREHIKEDLDRSVSLLGHLLTVEIPHQETSGLSPAQKRAAAYLVLSDLLVGIAKKTPLVFLFDDLHWIDEASLEWLQAFTDRIGHEGLSLLVILQHRPTTERNLSDWGDRVDLTRLRLRPLTPEESTSLVGEILQLEPNQWPPALRQLIGQVCGRAEGNPLYLTEMILSLVDAKVIVQHGNEVQVAPMRAGQTLPSTINGVVASRLDMLKPNLRSLLQVASVIGRSFHPQALGRIYPVQNLAGLLDELVRAEFLQARDNGEFAFNQAIIQEVAYQSLLLSSRRKLHQLLASSIEEALGARAEEQSKLLAYHWSRAEDPKKSCRYLFLAGEKAKASYSNMEALSQYKQSIEWLSKCTDETGLPSKVDILLSMAEIETTMGNYNQAQTRQEEALTLTQDPVVQARIFFALSKTIERRGDFEQALHRCEAGIQLLQGTGEKGGVDLARLLNEKGWLKYREGDYEGCLQMNQQALSHLKDSSDKKEMALAYSESGSCYYRMNRWSQSLESHRAALKFREEAGDAQGMAASLMNLGIIHYELGEWDQAGEYYQKSLAIYRKIGDIGNSSLLQVNLGDLLGNQGNVVEAERYLRQTLEINRRLGDSYMTGLSLCGIGNVISMDGRTDEAISLLTEGIGILENIGAVDLLAEVNQILGRVFLQAGRPDEGCRSLNKGMELATQTKNLLQVGVIRRLYAQNALARGNLEEASSQIQEALSILQGSGSKLELARAKWIACEILLKQGNNGEAVRQEAIAVFKQLNARLDLAQADAHTCKEASK